MSNPFKLVIVVLLFFLALTFVRGFSATGSSTEIVFSGDQRVPYTVSVSNPTNASVHPSFIAQGPFSILEVGAPEDAVLAPHATKAYSLFLVPASTLHVGDVFSGAIQVATSSDVKSIPLLLHAQDAPFFSAGAGLFTASSLVNAGLLVIIIILAIALVARVRNRVFGGKTQ